MKSPKLAKICFVFAAFLFVAKPFLGFCTYSAVHPPSIRNILVKAFTKRTLEYSRNGNFSAVQKKLADPVGYRVLLFTGLLSIIFPITFGWGSNITSHFLNNIQLGISPHRSTYLLNRQFII